MDIEKNNINGVNIISAGTGPEILLLDPTLQPSRVRQEHITRLAAYGRVISPRMADLVPNSFDPQLELTAANLKEVIEKLVQYRQLEIVGCSLGASLALAFVAKYKQFPINQVLACEPPGLISTKRSLINWYKASKRVQNQKSFLTGESLRREPTLLELIKEAKQDLKGTYRQFRRGLEVDLSGLLPTIEAPVRLLWGRNSQFIPTTHAKEALSDIRNAQLHLVSDLDHIWFNTHPELWMQYLDSVKIST